MFAKILSLASKKSKKIPTFLNDYYSALENGNDTRVAHYLCENCEMQIGSNETLKGRDAILAYVGNVSHFLLNLEFDFTLTKITNSLIVKEGFAYYTLMNGHVRTVPICHLLKTKDQKVNWHYIYRSSPLEVNSI